MKKLCSLCLALISIFVFGLNQPDFTSVIAVDSNGSGSEDEAKEVFEIKDGTVLVKYNGKDKHVSVPDQITKIGSNCFTNNENVVSVALPDTLQEIEAAAFIGCMNLQSVDIPDSVTQIGFGAFASCPALVSVHIPASVSVLEQLLFSNCTSLTEVEISGDALESIHYNCFRGCASLEEVTLPTSVKEIGELAFADCVSLQTVNIGDSLEQIGENAFQDCSRLESISIPDTVQYIAATAFDGCDRLKDTHTVDGSFVIDHVLIHAEPKHPVYRIPDGIVTAASHALHKTKSVSIECPNSLRYICDNAFSSNSILYEVLLNEGCETIGKNAFSECDSLNSLSVPATVKQIGAQEKCSLTDLYGSAGSAAEEFANENRITFHDGPEYHGPDLTLDYSKDGWYFGNSKAIFGDDYYLTDADSQYLNGIGFDATKMDRSWSGSCVGLAITVILAKNGAFSPSQLQAGANTLSAVEPTDAVRSFINYYHCIQDRGVPSPGYIPDALIFYRMQKNAKNIPNGESPFLLTFATKTGSHGVVGYGQEAGEWEIDGKTYDGRILVWDSNFPKALHDESCLYYDSTTFDYCIPHYGVHVAEGADDNTAGIITVCNDLRVLNAYPYPFETVNLKGDVDCNGAVQIADAVLLARYLAEDPVTVTAQGLLNAELDGNPESLDAGDFAKLLQIIAGVDTE